MKSESWSQPAFSSSVLSSAFRQQFHETDELDSGVDLMTAFRQQFHEADELDSGVDFMTMMMMALTSLMVPITLMNNSVMNIGTLFYTLTSRGVRIQKCWRWSKNVGVDDVIEDFIEIDVVGANEDQPFYIANLDDVVNRFKRWVRHIPRVHPFYTIKCNDDSNVAKVLASLGAGFDCASVVSITSLNNWLIISQIC